MKIPGRDERTALFRIDVIEIPVDQPQEARINPTARPCLRTPKAASWPVCGSAAITARAPRPPRKPTTAHDITAFPELGIAAGACSGNGILFDISDPDQPDPDRRGDRHRFCLLAFGHLQQ